MDINKISEQHILHIIPAVAALIDEEESVKPCALNRIKRLAAFSNPQFYKTQKMRMSTYGIPRIIYSLDETAEFIGIPRVCKQSLNQLLDSSQTNYIFEDKRNNGKSINVSFNGTLREEQQFVTNALLQYENGVLSVLNMQDGYIVNIPTNRML